MHCFKKVLILQRIVPEYRARFFSKLNERLKDDNIDLMVIYGQEYPGTVPRSININENWAVRIVNHYFKVGNVRLTWQPALISIFRSDMVIVEQGNSLLINYILLVIRLFTDKKVAYWGHGKNMQAQNPDSVSELIKKNIITLVDWWFAYTNISYNIVKSSGFSEKKITIVQNTIDTEGFSEALNRVENSHIESIKLNLGIHSNNILLYCGGIYSDKKIDFLLSTCFALRDRIPDLHVLFIGSGPEQYKIENVSNAFPWLHYLGPKFGNDRAVFFRMSKALLMPGLVGLSIIDSFVSNVPIFTTNIPIHSPEIDYLKNNINGVITPSEVNDYVEAIYSYLLSEDLQIKLMRGCEDSAKKFTIDNMVNNFYNGIISCVKGV